MKVLHNWGSFQRCTLPRGSAPIEITLLVKIRCGVSGKALSGCSQGLPGQVRHRATFCASTPLFFFNLFLPGCWALRLAPLRKRGYSLHRSGQVSPSPWRSQGGFGDPPRHHSVPGAAGGHPGRGFAARGSGLPPALLALPGGFPAMLET